MKQLPKIMTKQDREIIRMRKRVIANPEFGRTKAFIIWSQRYHKRAFAMPDHILYGKGKAKR